MKRKLIIIAVFLSVFMASCNKKEESSPLPPKEDPLTQIIIGEKPENSISLPFEPIIIGRGYRFHSESIGFSGQPYLEISNYFNVRLGDNSEYSTKKIKTLGNCLLKARKGAESPMVFRSGDVVVINSDFNPGTFDIAGLDNNSYLVYRYTTDKEYVGWIKIDHHGYDFKINDYCEYEIKY